MSGKYLIERAAGERITYLTSSGRWTPNFQVARQFDSFLDAQAVQRGRGDIVRRDFAVAALAERLNGARTCL